MSGKNKRYEGFLLTELTVSMTILGILVAGLALSLHGFAKFNRYQLVRQQCIIGRIFTVKQRKHLKLKDQLSCVYFSLVLLDGSSLQI